MVDDGALLIGDAGFVRQGDQIAAQRDVGILHRHADGERLQRRTAGVVVARVVAHNREVRGVAAGGHAVRNGRGHADHAARSQLVHHGGHSRRQRGLAAQLFNGLIGHAVAQNYNIFHGFISFLIIFSFN